MMSDQFSRKHIKSLFIIASVWAIGACGSGVKEAQDPVNTPGSDASVATYDAAVATDQTVSTDTATPPIKPNPIDAPCEVGAAIDLRDFDVFGTLRGCSARIIAKSVKQYVDAAQQSGSTTGSATYAQARLINPEDPNPQQVYVGYNIKDMDVGLNGKKVKVIEAGLELSDYIFNCQVPVDDKANSNENQDGVVVPGFGSCSIIPQVGYALDVTATSHTYQLAIKTQKPENGATLTKEQRLTNVVVKLLTQLKSYMPTKFPLTCTDQGCYFLATDGFDSALSEINLTHYFYGLANFTAMRAIRYTGKKATELATALKSRQGVHLVDGDGIYPTHLTVEATSSTELSVLFEDHSVTATPVKKIITCTNTPSGTTANWDCVWNLYYVVIRPMTRPSTPEEIAKWDDQATGVPVADIKDWDWLYAARNIDFVLPLIYMFNVKGVAFNEKQSDGTELKVVKHDVSAAAAKAGATTWKGIACPYYPYQSMTPEGDPVSGEMPQICLFYGGLAPK